MNQKEAIETPRSIDRLLFANKSCTYSFAFARSSRLRRVGVGRLVGGPVVGFVAYREAFRGLA